MAEKVLVLSADKWSMRDERTGEVNEGVTVFYVNDYRDDGDFAFGFKPTKITGNDEVLEQMRGKLPGHFELDFGSRPGAGGKATLVLTKARFIESAVLFPKGKAAASV